MSAAASLGASPVGTINFFDTHIGAWEDIRPRAFIDPGVEERFRSVLARLRDHRVAPIQTTEFWIATYDEAVRLARSIRASILAECAPELCVEQLAFDFALS